MLSLPSEDNLGVCWQEVGADLVCSRPRLDRQATYTECCCLYGEAWGMDCALCPAQDSGTATCLGCTQRPCSLASKYRPSDLLVLVPVLDPKSPQTQPLRPLCASQSLNLGPLVPKSYPKDLPVISTGSIVP